MSTPADHRSPTAASTYGCANCGHDGSDHAFSDEMDDPCLCYALGSGPDRCLCPGFRRASADNSAASTRRVNVNFSGEAWEALRYLADVRGSTISDVLRRSLATLKWAHDVQREGAHFIREDANGKRTEVIFL